MEDDAANNGRCGKPFCASGRMPSTVTVPPVTGVLIRARKVPETRPARYSTSLFAGTRIVVSVVQIIPSADPALGGVGVVCGQHSIATAPAVTLPLPWTLNVTKRASGSVRVRPSPVVVNACSAVVTFSKLIVLRPP